jgi:integrase
MKRPGTGVRGVSVLRHPDGTRGKWSVTVRASYRADGKPNRQHFVFRGTRREALEAGIEAREKLRGMPTSPGRLTVADLFERSWLPHKRAQAERDERSPTTADGYASNYQRFVAPFPLARLPLRRLAAQDSSAVILAWFNALVESRPLSPKTQHHALSTLRSALKHAVYTGLLPRDPFATFPREAWPTLHRGRPSKRSVGSAGMAAVRRAFEGHELEAEVALMTLGLRRGEILGLRIRGGHEDPSNGDVSLDGEAPKVRIRQVVVEVEGRGARIRRFPKSDASVRDLRLPAWIVPVLRAAKRRALELQLAAGDRFEDHGLLFPSRGAHSDPVGRWVGSGIPGRPRFPNDLSRKFRKRLREVGLEGFDPERVSPHALRHSFVSALINEAGMRAEDVQALAGHALLVTTQAYRALDEEPAAEAAAALDRLLQSNEST